MGIRAGINYTAVSCSFRKVEDRPGIRSFHQHHRRHAPGPSTSLWDASFSPRMPVSKGRREHALNLTRQKQETRRRQVDSDLTPQKLLLMKRMAILESWAAALESEDASLKENNEQLVSPSGTARSRRIYDITWLSCLAPSPDKYFHPPNILIYIKTYVVSLGEGSWSTHRGDILDLGRN
ncbi:hypothetical protein C8R44DRAFT_746420 [Mycena epipterygia]|nr:hypothetical protein C8R44DRAFT_746420 [Mycena epipterygia]